MAMGTQGGSWLPKVGYNRGNATDTAVNPTFPANSGVVPGSTVVAAEYGDPYIHRTVLTLTNLAMAVSDANVGGGSLDRKSVV